jgi:hypothetical protein
MAFARRVVVVFTRPLLGEAVFGEAVFGDDAC